MAGDRTRKENGEIIDAGQEIKTGKVRGVRENWERQSEERKRKEETWGGGGEREEED